MGGDIRLSAWEDTGMKTNWKQEFAPFRSNEDTARELATQEHATPNSLTAAEIQFVTDVLGTDALPSAAQLEADDA